MHDLLYQDFHRAGKINPLSRFHRCFILTICQGAFQQFNNRVVISKKCCHDQSLSSFTGGLSINRPSLQQSENSFWGSAGFFWGPFRFLCRLIEIRFEPGEGLMMVP